MKQKPLLVFHLVQIDRVNTVVFNLHQIKQRNFFGTLGRYQA